MVLSDNHSKNPLNNLQLMTFETFPGNLNMAIDHVLSLSCTPDSKPILRFYDWNPNCISIGYHQKTDVINFEKLANNDLDCVRRPTGGRAILHAEELTYSIVCPRNLMNHKDLYYYFHKILRDSLASLGYNIELMTENNDIRNLTHNAADFPCFTKSAETEIQYSGKKLIGSAQRIYGQAILQHGSILIGKEHQRLPKFLNATPSEIEIMMEEILDKTICLQEINNETISQEKIIESIVNQLELVRGISVNSRSLNQSEMGKAKKCENDFVLTLKS